MQVCLGVNHDTQQDVRDVLETQQDWKDVLARLVRMENALAAMVSEAAAAQQTQSQMIDALRVRALDVARMQRDTLDAAAIALSVVVQSQRDFMATVNSDSVEASPRLQSLSSNSSSDHSVSAWSSDDDCADPAQSSSSS